LKRLQENDADRVLESFATVTPRRAERLHGEPSEEGRTGRAPTAEAVIQRPALARPASLDAARARAEERLFSAALRLQAQVDTVAGGLMEPLFTQRGGTHVDFDRLAGEIERATVATARRQSLDAIRTEAVAAVESRVAAVSERVADACGRLQEVETGLETAGRANIALQLWFEQLRSSVELRFGALATELAETAARQLATERGLAAVASDNVRVRYEFQAPAPGQPQVCGGNSVLARSTVRELWDQLKAVDKEDSRP